MAEMTTVMKRYTKRPVTGVLAWRFDGSLPSELPISVRDDGTFGLWVEKSQAWCDLAIGDYVVTEPDHTGFYPCTGPIFQATHLEEWQR
jgi:hypothetical protein